ncbi:hypothetical protein FHP26_20390 [Pseudomonas orientalis]|nr:hypothetical protein [Pseudomonas orientalis]
MWRGSLRPLGSEAAPPHPPCSFRGISVGRFGSAAQPSGSKLPRHSAGWCFELNDCAPPRSDSGYVPLN